VLNDDEVIFIGRDNKINLILYENDTAVDLSAVTQIRLAFANTTVVLTATASTGPVISWAQTTYATGEVVINAGGSSLISSVMAGRRYRCSLVTFDPDNSTGLVWDDNIPVRVKADPLAT
jgi:hypothetical protein